MLFPKGNSRLQVAFCPGTDDFPTNRFSPRFPACTFLCYTFFFPFPSGAVSALLVKQASVLQNIFPAHWYVRTDGGTAKGTQQIRNRDSERKRTNTVRKKTVYRLWWQVSVTHCLFFSQSLVTQLNTAAILLKYTLHKLVSLSGCVMLWHPWQFGVTVRRSNNPLKLFHSSITFFINLIYGLLLSLHC